MDKMSKTRIYWCHFPGEGWQRCRIESNWLLSDGTIPVRVLTTSGGWWVTSVRPDALYHARPKPSVLFVEEDSHADHA